MNLKRVMLPVLVVIVLVLGGAIPVEAATVTGVQEAHNQATLDCAAAGDNGGSLYGFDMNISSRGAVTYVAGTAQCQSSSKAALTEASARSSAQKCHNKKGKAYITVYKGGYSCS